MQCFCAHDGVRGGLPCPFQNLSHDLDAAVMPAATPWEQEGPTSGRSLPPVILLLLFAGNGLGRSLARARVGMGALAAHRQAAAMTKAAIATKIHQTLDVHAGLATKV